MKKLQMLTAAAGILLALAGPSLAAQRVNRGVDAYASATGSDRSGPYYYGPQDAQGRRSIRRAGPLPLSTSADRACRSADRTCRIADRPYGDPDSW